MFEVVSWQGENLQGAAMFPVALPADKVVYSPLIGLPSTQPYERTYTDPAFPHNMREVWDDNWGYLMREGRAAVVVGQFGGSTFEGADRAYQVELVGYLRQISAGGFYFALEQDGLLEAKHAAALLAAADHEEIIDVFAKYRYGGEEGGGGISRRGQVDPTQLARHLKEVAIRRGSLLLPHGSGEL